MILTIGQDLVLESGTKGIFPSGLCIAVLIQKRSCVNCLAILTSPNAEMRPLVSPDAKTTAIWKHPLSTLPDLPPWEPLP